LIKGLVDVVRRSDGYSGMAIYRDGIMLFSEGMEPSLAGRAKAMFDEVRGRCPARSVSLVIRGYTINALMAEDVLILCTSEGRFTPRPALPDAEPEYTAGQAPPGLITREEARKEAAAMLKLLMSRDSF